jgi:hypothetical protein
MVGTFFRKCGLSNAIDNGYRLIGPESCGIIKPPNVVSISYGEDEASAPIAYLQRQCREYAKVRYICDQLFLLLRFLRFFYSSE